MFDEKIEDNFFRARWDGSKSYHPLFSSIFQIRENI